MPARVTWQLKLKPSKKQISKPTSQSKDNQSYDLERHLDPRPRPRKRRPKKDGASVKKARGKKKPAREKRKARGGRD